jgi:hypothetical protein
MTSGIIIVGCLELVEILRGRMLYFEKEALSFLVMLRTVSCCKREILK